MGVLRKSPEQNLTKVKDHLSMVPYKATGFTKRTKQATDEWTKAKNENNKFDNINKSKNKLGFAKLAALYTTIGAGSGVAGKIIKDKTTSNFDKAKEAASTLKDVGKDAISNNSGKVGAIAGGTAAAIGGGLALKKYLKGRKNKGT